MVHGDIKPDNILLKRFTDAGNERWKVRINDLGLANRVGGTPIFMSCENLLRPVLEKSDVYSFGMTAKGPNTPD